MTILEQARNIRAAMDAAGATLTDEQAAEMAAIFMPWQTAIPYTVGNRVRYGEHLYRCLTAHTSQASWTPDAAPSLWVRVDDPNIEWPDWSKPMGSTDAYPKGAKVSHNGKRWVSIVDANVWEPPTQWEEQA